MTIIIHCSKSDSAVSIAAALQNANPGQIVEVDAGEFLLVDTLSVPEGVTLKGAGMGQTVFVHDSEFPAIQVVGAKDVSLSDFSIKSLASNTPFKVTPDASPIAPDDVPDDPAPTEWGLLWISESEQVSVNRVSLTNFRDNRYLRGIVARESSSISFLECEVSNFGGSGLSLYSAKNTKIHSCSISMCKHGIMLFQSAVSKAPSEAIIVGNSCHKNADVGIILFSSNSECLSDNECWENGSSGIVLSRSVYSPNEASFATITANRCYKNADGGIVLSSSNSDELSNNECWENGGSGIALQRDPICPNETPTANITANRCIDNVGFGIALGSVISNSIEKNVCSGNNLSGIALFCDSSFPDSPSSANILSNMCHNNTEGGILLISSNSDNLSDNECYENGVSGIVLQRSLYSPNVPSTANILRNRCYDNTDHGIQLISSRSNNLSDNECWENGGSGVYLHPIPGVDEKAYVPDIFDGSYANIKRNRCYENEYSGISLASSNSDCLSDNECWENRYAGITLQRISNSPGSIATITDNRCHSNQRAFTCDISASVKQSGNIAFLNRQSSSFIAPNRQILNPLDWELLSSDETPAETLKHLRGIQPSGALAAELDKQGMPDPDTLARFLYGSGGLGDLKRWLGLRTEPEDTKEEVEEGYGGTYRLKTPESGNVYSEDTIKFTKEGSATLQSVVWNYVQKHVQTDQPDVVIIGAFGDQGAAVQSVLQDAARLNGYDIDAMSKDNPLPTGRIAMVREFGLKSMKIAKPLVYDCSVRSGDAFTEKHPKDPFLEPERPGNIDIWSSRLGFVLRSPELIGGAVLTLLMTFTVAVGVGAVKGYPDPWSNLVGAAFHAIKLNINDLEFWDVLTLPLSLLALGSLFAFANRALPHHLALRVPFGKMGENSESVVPKRGRAWRHWVRRRVFGGGDIAIVVLQNLQEWPKGDIQGFHDLIMFRPKNKSLIVIVESPTRAILDRTLVRALPSDDICSKVFVCIGAEADKLTLDGVFEKPDTANLFGVDAANVSPRLEQIGAGILGDKFSISDITPMIVIGSSNIMPFGIDRRIDPTFANYGPEFMQTLVKFAKIFSGDPDLEFDLSNDAGQLDGWLQESRNASSAFVTRRVKDRTEYYRVFGRFQKRGDVISAIQSVYGANRSAQIDYVRAMLKCGENYALEFAAWSLEQPSDAEPRMNRALAAMKSAAILQQDYKAITINTTQIDLARQTIVDTQWLKLVKAIGSIRNLEANLETTLAQIYASSLHHNPASEVLLSGNAPDGSARAAFEKIIVGALDRFEYLDRKLAMRKASADLGALIPLMPKQTVLSLTKMISARSTIGVDLANLFEDAITLEEIQLVMVRHKMIPHNVAATLISIATRLADTLDSQITLGVALCECKVELTSISANSVCLGVPRGNSINLEGIVRAFETPEFVDFLGPDSTNKAMPDFSAMEVMYGSLADMFSSGEQTKRIEFGGLS